MKELKTMEDLEAENSNKKPEETMWICSVRLKQEAIKWIRELKKEVDSYIGFPHTMDWNNDIRLGKIEWIKHFFNITEEDLK